MTFCSRAATLERSSGVSCSRQLSFFALIFHSSLSIQHARRPNKVLARDAHSFENLLKRNLEQSFVGIIDAVLTKRQKGSCLDTFDHNQAHRHVLQSGRHVLEAVAARDTVRKRLPVLFAPRLDGGLELGRPSRWHE